MTTTEIVLRNDTLDLAVIEPLNTLAERIARTGFVPEVLQGKPEAVLACMLTGQEVGIGPMASLRQIHNIKGRVALGAELMRALIQRAGHEIWFGTGNDFTSTRVVIFGCRQGSSKVVEVAWTWDMVEKAGLKGKDNYRNFPRQMLTARATSELARLMFADVILGLGYTPEELEDLDTVDAEIVEEPRTSTRKATAAARRRPRKVQSEPVAAAEPAEPDLPGDDIEDAEIVEQKPTQAPKADEQTDAEKERSTQVVRLAKAMKIDHHPVVAAITAGAKDSARRLTAQEAAEVMSALRSIDEGRARIEQDGDRVRLLAVEQAGSSTPEPEDDIEDAEVVDDDEDQADDASGPEEWDSDQWREFLKAHDIKVTQLIRQAAVFARGSDVAPPASLASVAGSGMALQLAAWVEEQGQ